MKIRINLFLILISFAFSESNGQLSSYTFKHELTGISGTWNNFILPDEIFSKTKYNLSDIRIYGINESGDTIEAPYLLKVTRGSEIIDDVLFKIINESHNENGYYFTFEIPSKARINQIMLEFKKQNFDHNITLEGSDNRMEWFTILENYRVLSIKNKRTDFKFTEVSFPESEYTYYRIYFPGKINPELIKANVARKVVAHGILKTYPAKAIKTILNKTKKQTEIDIQLSMPLPISSLKLGVIESIDFYRPITIEYVSDSFKSEQGWKYNYIMLTNSTLNSLGSKEFKFESTILKIIKVTIYNGENKPLNFTEPILKGFKHEIITRITEPADYILVYGNSQAAKPRYDIERFIQNIPDSLTTLLIGNEQFMVKPTPPTTDPLFQNKLWLWMIIIIIVLLLGWFSINMMRKK